jgi:hypothetical protein
VAVPATAVPAAFTVSEPALYPHAASALSAANASKDFIANPNPKRRLRRELIMRLPIQTFFPRSLIPFIRNHWDHIFIGSFKTANLSPFAN